MLNLVTPTASCLTAPGLVPGQDKTQTSALSSGVRPFPHHPCLLPSVNHNSPSNPPPNEGVMPQCPAMVPLLKQLFASQFSFEYK